MVKAKRFVATVGTFVVGLGMLTVGSVTRAEQFKEDLFKAMKWRLIGPFRGGRVIAVAGVPG